MQIHLVTEERVKSFDFANRAVDKVPKVGARLVTDVLGSAPCEVVLKRHVMRLTEITHWLLKRLIHLHDHALCQEVLQYREGFLVNEDIVENF